MSPRPTLLPEQLAPRPSRFRNFLDAFCCGPRLGLSITSPGTATPKPGLAGYYSADIRALGREVRQQLREADEDTDVASVTILSRGPEGDVLRADGAVVVIKGGNYVELFMQWAARTGMLTRGKPIVTGLVWRPEDAASLVGAADASSPTYRGSR